MAARIFESATRSSATRLPPSNRPHSSLMPPTARSAWPLGADCWKSIREPSATIRGAKSALATRRPSSATWIDCAGHLEFAAQADRCLQALGQGLREGRNVRAFLDAGRSIDVQPDGQVERGDGHRFRALRGIEQPLAFRQLDFDPQHLLLLQSSAFGQLLGHLQVVFGPADRVAGGLPQGPCAQDLVVRHRDLIGHRLVGPLALQLSNLDGETGLAIPAQPTAEVTDEPLQLQVGQLVAGVDVQPNGYRSQGRKEREAGKRPQRRAVAADVQVEAADRISRHRHRQERSEGDVLAAPGLLDALQVDAQPRLLPERRFDRLGKGESFGGRSGKLTALNRNLQVDVF